MTNAVIIRSPCEIIREINDMFQSNIRCKLIRKKCAEIENLAKAMSVEINKTNKDY
ncbi:MAG: hypothetical protein NTZ85_01685 [Bacteroidia bacterium]|nr:hypothetical protein [Bacteroidia bacterium]